MRRPAHALAALPAAVPLVACCLSPPAAHELLAVGFRRPEQTFRTFQTALRADLPDLEYRCLSGDFKRREGGITEILWREYRERLFREQPWLKLAARAEIVATTALPDGRVRITARVEAFLVDEVFLVDFVREDFYESFDGEGLLEDAVASWQEIAVEREGRLVVSVPAPEGASLDEITEFRAGREWKIDGFHVPAEP